MISHHALNLMVKYDGTTFKSEENFVNVRERLLEIAGVQISINIATFKKLKS